MTAQKGKPLKQKYRKMINENRRFGSGKIVVDNWDELKQIWGSSLSTKSD